MEYRNLIYLFYIKIMFPIHLAVQNLNLSSFMLFLLILNLEFGIIIIIFFLAAHNLTCTVFPCYSSSSHLIWFLLQSEYVSERDKRREFVSGFTGSAGQF